MSDSYSYNSKYSGMDELHDEFCCLSEKNLKPKATTGFSGKSGYGYQSRHTFHDHHEESDLFLGEDSDTAFKNNRAHSKHQNSIDNIRAHMQRQQEQQAQEAYEKAEAIKAKQIAQQQAADADQRIRQAQIQEAAARQQAMQEDAQRILDAQRNG